VTIATITVVTLVSLDFVFKSYYAMMTDEATREKLSPTTDKDEVHKAEQAALTNAAMPIDQAMAQFAKGQRAESITPQQSEDMAPLTGWSKLPKPLPTPPPMGAAGAPHDEHSVMGDAGAAMAGDGGVPLVAGDAGAAAPVRGDAGAAAPPRAPGAGADAGAGHRRMPPPPGQPMPTPKPNE
jgi:hypothetical protein